MDTKQDLSAGENPDRSPVVMTDPVSALDRTFVLPDGDDQRLGRSGIDRELLQRMSFRVGELGLLLPWDAGREVVSPPGVSRIPNTASWFAGLGNVRGGLLPVVDIAAAFGVARQSGVPRYLLAVGHGEEALGLLVDGLPQLVDIDVSQRLASLPELPEMLEGGVVWAAYEHTDRVWLDLNLGALYDALDRSIPV